MNCQQRFAKQRLPARAIRGIPPHNLTHQDTGPIAFRHRTLFDFHRNHQAPCSIEPRTIRCSSHLAIGSTLPRRRERRSVGSSRHLQNAYQKSPCLPHVFTHAEIISILATTTTRASVWSLSLGPTSIKTGSHPCCRP